MATTGEFKLPEDLLQRAVHASSGRTQQEVVIDDGLALLTSGNLDHPDRDTGWH